MNTTRTNKYSIIATLAFAVTVGLIASGAQAASSEITEMDSQTSAKVARQRIKNRSAANRRKAGRGSNEDCGTVDIGNNDSQRNARGRVNPRNTTIIVTGPIINAANCR